MRVLAATLLVLFTAVGCNEAVTEAAPAALREVTVEPNAFTPQSVVIRLGGTVRFTFQGTAHSIIFTEQPGRPENVEVPVANTTEERVFDTAGTFSYTCADHRTTMNGTVTVRAVTETPDDEG